MVILFLFFKASGLHATLISAAIIFKFILEKSVSAISVDCNLVSFKRSLIRTSILCDCFSISEITSSSTYPSSEKLSVSKYPNITVKGVFSSWETFAIKSLLILSNLSDSDTSLKVSKFLSSP